MHLIVIVVALLLERTLVQLARLRRISVFARYIRLIERLPGGRAWLARPLGVLVIVPPVGAVAWCQWVLASHDWLGVSLLFSLFVLLVSFGPRDLWEDVYALAHARDQAAHDEAEARALALARRAGGHQADISDDTLLGAVLIQGHERLLSVLLWFFVAGPTGALFYRLARELPWLAACTRCGRTTAHTAEYIHGLAAFIPARLTVLVYAVVGQSRLALSSLRAEYRLTWRLSATASWRLLAAVGRAALGTAQTVGVGPAGASAQNARLLAALSLMSRSLILVLAALSVATLMGFAS